MTITAGSSSLWTQSNWSWAFFGCNWCFVLFYFIFLLRCSRISVLWSKENTTACFTDRSNSTLDLGSVVLVWILPFTSCEAFSRKTLTLSSSISLSIFPFSAEILRFLVYGKGNDNPLQYSCMENSMDRGTWWAIQPMGSQRVRHDWATKPPPPSGSQESWHMIFRDKSSPYTGYSSLSTFLLPLRFYWSISKLQNLTHISPLTMSSSKAGFHVWNPISSPASMSLPWPTPRSRHLL